MRTLGSSFALALRVWMLASVVMMVSGARLHRVKRSAGRPEEPKLTLDNIAEWARLGKNIGFRMTTGVLIHNPMGSERCRLTQTHHGIEVWGTTAEVEVASTGELTGHIYGHVYKDLEDDIPNIEDCTRDLMEMVNLAVIHEGFDPNDRHIESKEIQRIIYVKTETGKGHLAYMVQFLYITNVDILFPVYVIDACSYSVLLHYNQIQNSSHTPFNHHEDGSEEPEIPCQYRRPKNGITCDPSVTGAGGNAKIGCVVYNEPPKCLRVRKKGETCTMKNKFARVYDNKRSRSTVPQDVIQFNCGNGYRDAVNGAYGVANDAFFFGNLIGEFYEEKYAMRALPYIPRLVVHFGMNYENAFWNGYDLFFGDGYRTFYPLVSLDVTTHEMAHGITSRNSKLIYKNQPGGINEAFSDISGETVEYYGKGLNDWQIGWEIFKAKRALRYLYDPTKDGRSVKHLNDYTDSLNVHFSSGIFNHAFYRMVTVGNMHIYDAYTCFLHANLLIWNANTNFTEGACGVLQACEDNGFKCETVIKAFESVGIDLSGCDAYALTPVLYPGHSRSNVVVSKSRNPTFELNLSEASNVVQVTATTRSNKEVDLTVSADRDVTDIILEGKNTLNIPVEEVSSVVYLTLSGQFTKDTMVHLELE